MVNCHVSLQEINVGVAHQQSATRGEDACAGRLADAEGIADRYDRVAHGNTCRGAQTKRRQVSGVDLKKCDIGRRIRSDDLRR